jgi:hypothetical protein
MYMKHTIEEVHENMNIPGYDYGVAKVAQSPVSLEDLRQLEQTLGWSEADAAVLRHHADLIRRKAEAMVDSWRAVIASQPHLAKWFFGPDGKKDEAYAAKVKPRFVQWIIDVATRPHDQSWLDYQEEIGLRHTPQKKSQTDHRQTPPLVPMRYLLGFIPQVTLGARKFFVDGGVDGEELTRLEDAWTKAVHLHVTLWTRPYAMGNLW